jgi:hypothetical protein
VCGEASLELEEGEPSGGGLVVELEHRFAQAVAGFLEDLFRPAVDVYCIHRDPPCEGAGV